MINFNVFFILGNTRKTTKVRWTEEERNIVLNAFSQFITDKKLPPTKLVQKLLDENPNLKRTVATIRTWIHNQHSGQLKKMEMINYFLLTQ